MLLDCLKALEALGEEVLEGVKQIFKLSELLPLHPSPVCVFVRLSVDRVDVVLFYLRELLASISLPRHLP